MFSPDPLAGDRPSHASWLQRSCDALAVATATVFVAWHLHPELLISSTITTGGDTASHYYTASWLRHELLPAGRLTGWVPGNYAGFPLFQVYFPLPFVVMALLSFVTGLPVAFKLVTVAGLVGLPVAAYTGFRLLRLPFPAPALAAAFTLPFLFHEANSVWGANVASTLAGEFTYAFGTALLLVFAGTLYRGATSGRGWIGNGVLLAAIGLSHAYTLLAAGAFGAYLILFHPDGRRALPYLLKVGALAFGLIAFWAVPLLAYGEYTTAYSVVWPINGFSHLFPSILWPWLVVFVIGVGWQARSRVRASQRAGRGLDHRGPYLASLVAGGVCLYLMGWLLDVVDIRFLPFAQLMLVLLAALPAGAAVRQLTARRRQVAPVAAALVVIAATGAWTHSRIAFVDDWATWNYAGFEAAPNWPAFRAVNDAVSRSSADPRVVYEHTTTHDESGSIRAFESLPLFSGASTLEGIYMQSTISSPFVFYVQSEISEIPSCPLLPYHCGRLSASRAAEHLRLFNVSEVITRGEDVAAVLDASPEFIEVATVPPYRVFHVEGTSGAYVEPLAFEPLVLTEADWKTDFFAWFKRPGSGEVPLVRAEAAEAPTAWARVGDLPERIPRRPLGRSVDVTAEVAPEEIRIRTSRPGHPLLVKVSYHPRWRVDGADRVWLASPSFMLIVPEREDVRLVYGPTGADWSGAGLTLLAVAVVLVGGFRRLIGHRPITQPLTNAPADAVFRVRRTWAPLLVALLALGAVGARLAWTDPWVPHREGLTWFNEQDYERAEPFFLESIAAAPSSTAAYYSAFYYALAAARGQRWPESLERFNDFVLDYPDGELVPEARFRRASALERLGRTDDAVAAFLHLIDEHPDTTWAGQAAERLGRTAAAYDRTRSAAATAEAGSGRS